MKRKPGTPANEWLAGICTCGMEIRMGNEYKTRLDQETVITRPCVCGRKNSVVLLVSHRVRRHDWHAWDCDCGKPIYLPTRAKHLFKNSTHRYSCTCGVKWKFKITWKHNHDDNWTRSIQPTVYRLVRNPDAL